VKQFMNGYVQSPMLMDGIDEYIISPSLGNRSGGLGAVAMAMELVG
jgi:fructokinase